MKKTNNKGFSLVELIIVIAIMAVLIGVLAPQFIKYVERSRESTDLQNIEEVKTAVETYVADHGEDPSLPSTITVTMTNGSTIAPSVDLTEYGIASTGIKVKSSKWTPATNTYSYPTSGTSAYKWANPTGSAVYFDLTGSSIK
jgi:type IV pilus assembly protein PilA